MNNTAMRSHPPVDATKRLTFVIVMIILLLATGWMWYNSVPTIEVATTVIVPKQNQSAYQFISSTNFVETSRPETEILATTITNTASISGFVTLTPLTAKRPFTSGQVIPVSDKTLVNNTIVIAVEGGPDLAFGGQLAPGSIVSAWAGKNRLLDRLLVIDVQEFESNGKQIALPRYVVILAIPPTLRDKLIVAAAKGDLSFSFIP